MAGRCFFLEDALIHADVAIILGMKQWWRPARMGIELYRAGLVGTLLFTGGNNASIDACEAEEMAALARRAQVPDTAILVEPRAAHTEENFLLSKSVLEERVGMDNLRSVMLVTIQYHLRRAILAARRHLPSSVALGWACYPSVHYTSSTWQSSARGWADVASEIEKIREYYGLSLSELARQCP